MQPVETVAAESCPLFRVLRRRAPSSPICLSEEIRKSFALSRVFLLSSGGKSIVLVKEKAPSRSGIATCVVQTYLLLVHNFYPYAEQQSPVVVTHPTSIGRGSDHYWFAHRPLLVQRRTSSGCYCKPIVVHSPTTMGYFPTLVLLCATVLRKRPSEEAENGPAGGVNAA